MDNTQEREAFEAIVKGNYLLNWHDPQGYTNPLTEAAFFGFRQARASQPAGVNARQEWASSIDGMAEIIAWVLNDIPKGIVGDHAGLDGNKIVGRQIAERLRNAMQSSAPATTSTKKE